MHLELHRRILDQVTSEGNTILLLEPSQRNPVSEHGMEHSRSATSGYDG